MEKETQTREKKWEDVKDSMKSLTVPVSSLIPGLNLEGMLPKGTPKGGELRYEGLIIVSERDDEPTICESSIKNRIDEMNNILPGTWVHRDEMICTEFAPNVYSDIVHEIRRNNEQVKSSLACLKDQIVVDLSAGANPYGYFIADLAKARGYVGVEPVFSEELISNIATGIEGEDFILGICHTHNETPIAVMAEDMLSFLRRLPDDSVSFFCSGIDEFIMPYQDYEKACGREIFRALNPDGAYIGEKCGGHISYLGPEIGEERIDGNAGTIFYHHTKAHKQEE